VNRKRGSLPKEELLQMQCEYFRQMLNSGSPPLAVGNRCAEETAGMDRLLARKYAIKAKGEAAIFRRSAPGRSGTVDDKTECGQLRTYGEGVDSSHSMVLLTL
jgi:hypothetical protein